MTRLPLCIYAVPTTSGWLLTDSYSCHPPTSHSHLIRTPTRNPPSTPRQSVLRTLYRGCLLGSPPHHQLERRHFPTYSICMARTGPLIATAKVVVICHLPPSIEISTPWLPCSSIVQELMGIPVYCQVRKNVVGLCFWYYLSQVNILNVTNCSLPSCNLNLLPLLLDKVHPCH